MTMPPSPVVPQAPVTILDVYTKQIELAGDLKLIRQQLEAIPDHEGRIRRLEDARAKMIGAAVAVSALVSGLGTWIGVVLTRH
jgi:hypothetical protein